MQRALRGHCGGAAARRDTSALCATLRGMTVALRKPMSLAEFLAWEERQELRFEFDGFQPVAMTGGTFAHDQITFNLRKALDSRLRGKPCRPAGPNVKILTRGKARYPDGLVTCMPIKPDATVIDSPVVVFEVVSEDTARTDRIEKLREYQAVVSIQRYVILEQRTMAATVFERRGEVWTAYAITEEDTLRMPEIEIEVPLAELYEALDFATPPLEAGL
jgi:Uma2 family endonuclease